MKLPVYITGVGAAVPDRTLTNEQIEAGMPWLDLSAEWITEHTGIRRRRVALPSEHATDLGFRAGVEALAEAGCRPDELDLILLATNTAHYVYPAGAALIQEQLAAAAVNGQSPAAAAHTASLDLQQGCASFVAGIVLATGMIRSGSCERILVIGADVGTRMVDWTDRSSVLLGDGGTACVMTNRLPARPAAGPVRPSLEVLATYMRTIPDRESIFQRGVLETHNDPFLHMERAAAIRGKITREKLYAHGLANGEQEDRYRFFQMEGKKVFRFVRRTVAALGYVEVLRRAGLLPAAAPAPAGPAATAAAAAAAASGASSAQLLDEAARSIDLFLPHGANLFLNQELADQMRLPYERMAVTLQEHGNTSAASVGLTLHQILRGPIDYMTIAKRDAHGTIVRPMRAIHVDRLRAGQTALLLSFGAGTSWNYVVTRAV